MTYNQNLYDAQWLTVQNDIAKAVEKIASLRRRLEDRATGVIKQGKSPTKTSVENQCKNFLKRQHMKRLIKIAVTEGSDGIPQIEL